VSDVSGPAFDRIPVRIHLLKRRIHNGKTLGAEAVLHLAEATQEFVVRP